MYTRSCKILVSIPLSPRKQIQLLFPYQKRIFSHRTSYPNITQGYSNIIPSTNIQIFTPAKGGNIITLSPRLFSTSSSPASSSSSSSKQDNTQTTNPSSSTSNENISSSSSTSSVSSSNVMSLIRSVLQAGKNERDKKKKLDTYSDTKLNQTTLKRLLEFARPEAKTLGAAVATVGITTGISLFFPYAIGQILDVAIAPANAFSSTTISLGLLGLFIVQSGMITLRSALLNIAGERMAAHIRKDVLKNILAQDIGWFDSQRTGDIITRLSSDTVVIQKAVTSNIASALRSGSMVIGGTIMLFYLSPTLALLSLGLIPPVAIAGMTYGRYVQGQQRAVQEAIGKTMEVAEELVSSIRTVRQFAREGQEASRFATRVEDSYQLARQIGVVAAYFDGIVHMAANISLVAVLWYGSTQVATGAMSAGDLTAFLMYSLYTGLNISTLSTVYTDLKRASGAASRLFEVTDRTPQIPLAAETNYWIEADTLVSQPGSVFSMESFSPLATVEQKKPNYSPGVLINSPYSKIHHNDAATKAISNIKLKKLEHIKGEVNFQNISFAYPTRSDQLILNNFNLHLPAGTSLALVGSSGSGKSTVGALLTRLYDPSQGTIFIDDINIKELDPQYLRSSIGVVSQEPTLFAMTIADNIRYGKPHATEKEIIEAAKAANAHEFISKFPLGYQTSVGERGTQLSGGQKQRLAIARLILKNSPILVLDEATSALDSESEAAVTEALDQLMKGRTTITIAHRLSTMRNADFVAVLDDGKVIEMGKFDILFNDSKSAFRQLIDRQTLGLVN